MAAPRRHLELLRTLLLDVQRRRFGDLFQIFIRDCIMTRHRLQATSVWLDKSQTPRDHPAFGRGNFDLLACQLVDQEVARGQHSYVLERPQARIVVVHMDLTSSFFLSHLDGVPFHHFLRRP